MDRTELARRFARTGWKDDVQARSIFDFLMTASQQSGPNDIVLDLGAGECRYAFFFEHCHYIAVDFAQGDASWNYAKLDLIGDITRPSFIKDHSVDSCVSTTTLEHLAEPWNFFAEVRRILKPGGRLYLYVPFVMPEHQAPHDFYRYTRYGLQYLCDTSGLTVVTLRPSNGPLYTGVRHASGALSLISKRPVNRIPVLALKALFRFFVIPVFDLLDEFSDRSTFPQSWMLLAQNGPVPSDGLTSVASQSRKQDVVFAIIQCPICKAHLSEGSRWNYVCSLCGRVYPSDQGRINFLQRTDE